MPIPIIDFHCDTADRLAWGSLPLELKTATGKAFYGPGDEERPSECAELNKNCCHISLEKTAAQPWAQCMACFIPDELTPEQSVQFYNHVAAYRSEQLAKYAPYTVSATTPAQIRSALEAEQPVFAGISTIENARLFAAEMSLVEKLSQDGVLIASLSWNAAGPLASGHDTHQGLTELGKQALLEMERTGMVFDVSHLNDECFAEVAKLAKKPIIATHSNARAVCSHKRNLTDDQFKFIRDNGGIVGLNLCSGFLVDGAWGEAAKAITFEQIAAHLEHWLSLGGEDVIAWGADWDGCDTPSILADASYMPAFQEKLLAHFGEGITRKLCYENALNFLER